jgi:predicted house-cleaning noncanonical NTP pyrophosphatase (MazG superfamily)
MAKKKKRGRPKNRLNHEVYAELKAKKKNKKVIRPGFWSKVETDLVVKAKLKKHIPEFYFPPYLGKYVTHDDGYSGDGYRALVKITADRLAELIQEHGIDQVLAACEKSLNSYKNKYGRKLLGDFVICEILQEKLEEEVPFVTCLIKTNKKRISKFLGMKTAAGGRKELVVF